MQQRKVTESGAITVRTLTARCNGERREAGEQGQSLNVATSGKKGGDPVPAKGRLTRIGDDATVGQLEEPTMGGVDPSPVQATVEDQDLPPERT